VIVSVSDGSGDMKSKSNTMRGVRVKDKGFDELFGSQNEDRRERYVQRVFLLHLPSPTATSSRPLLVLLLDLVHEEKCVTK
jgi:hypothetical protein